MDPLKESKKVVEKLVRAALELTGRRRRSSKSSMKNRKNKLENGSSFNADS